MMLLTPMQQRPSNASLETVVSSVWTSFSHFCVIFSWKLCLNKFYKDFVNSEKDPQLMGINLDSLEVSDSLILIELKCK